MLLHVDLLLIFLSTCIAFNVNKTSKSIVESKSDAVTYLNKFGYNPCERSTNQLCSLSLSSMLKEFQRRFRLRVTGILDDDTKQEMNRARCGNKDPTVDTSRKAPVSLIRKWRRSILTWSLRSYSSRIGSMQSQIILRRAFDNWSKHIPMTINQVCSTCSADLTIEFSSAYHGDSYPFDGSGGTLSHAYFPEDGRIHFDIDESWTTSYDGNNINFFLVAVHEIGHALGLEHVYEKSSIMYPSYQLFQEKDILPYYDRINIQRIYGSASKATTLRTTKQVTLPRPITRTTTTTTRRTPSRSTAKNTIKTKTTTRFTSTLPSNTKYPCQLFMNAAFDFPDKSFHILHSGMLRRYLPNKKRWDNLIRPFQSIYRYLPKGIVGGTYNFATNEILIFSSTRVYRYRINLRSYKVMYRRDDLLPKYLQGNIVGAIFYRDVIHVIKANTLHSFDINNLNAKSNERKLKEKFPGFEGSVKAAFTSGYLHHFFTTNRLVYIWDEQFNRWKTFGKPMETNWFACMKTNYI